MKEVVLLKESVHLNMGIDFCGADLSVAQKKLHRAQISSAFQEMCGKRVPEGVRRDLACDMTGSCTGFDAFPDILAYERLAETIEEDAVDLRVKEGSCLLEIAEELLLGETVDGHKTGFAAFADNVQNTALQVKIFEGQAAEFRNPEPCGIEQLKHAGISASCGLGEIGTCEQGRHFLSA